MNIPRWFRLVVCLLPTLAMAAPPVPTPAPAARQIPPVLREWESWATWNDPHKNCPTPFNNGGDHVCFWPSRLGLQVERAGGRFDLGVTVFHETWVPLPGGGEGWPLEVKVGGVVVPVLEHDGRPSVRLAAGTHRIEGVFRWDEIPQGLPVPPEIGLLVLTLEGQAVTAPSWDDRGFLWLRRDAAPEEADRDFLSVKVYALIEDGIPMWLRTKVELIVSGKSREEDIGSILPEGWKLSAVDSPLPVIVDDAGRMKVQVRTGKWTITATAFRVSNATEFRYAGDAQPAVEEELVAFGAKPDFRMVDISGAPSIDVSQTTFPDEWRGFPVYRWDTAAPLRIEERMRGMGEQAAQGLRINRLLWLDEDGRKLTFRDRINGKMQQIWRLDSAEGQDLGSVRSGDEGQLITRNAQNQAPGVEIRTRDIDLVATGRMESASSLSASGWRADADALTVVLNLPPGWRLFALFGSDWVKGDWLTAWTLLDLFLLLIFTLAVFRLWGFGPAVIAFLAFGISYHEPGAPRYVWLVLLIPLALLRVVALGWGRRILQVWKWVMIVIFIMVLVPFLSAQVQQALFPQLENIRPYRAQTLSDFDSSVSRSMADVSAAVPNAPGSSAGLGGIQARLDQTMIPKLDFQDATVREVLSFLQSQSNGVAIVLKLPPGSSQADARITLTLTDIPLRSAIDYVAAAANLKVKIEPNAVLVVPAAEATEALVTKEYRVPPGFIPVPSQGKLSLGSSSRSVGAKANAKDFMESLGVGFPPGASATYRADTGVLIVRNTPDNLDLIDSLTEASLAVAPGGSGSNLMYDSKARIQTGPGVPDWTWRQVSFGWNGPVQASQRVHPILISLTVERVLTVLRIALLLLLAVILLNARQLGRTVFRAGRAALLTALLAMSVTGAGAQAFPDKEMLETLRQRLLETSDAFPHAASIPTVSLTIKDRRLTMDAEIHAALRTAVPLPGRLPEWSPVTITIDGKPESAIRRDDGFLWVVIPEGVHRVQVTGLLADVTEWEWTFYLKPRRVTIDAPEWNVSGIRADGRPEQQVFFVLKQKTSAGQASYERQDYQSLVEVERHLELGLVWQVRTTVKRLTPDGKALSLRVPLLPGENVVSANAVVRDGSLEVRLGAREGAYSWESELHPVENLKLLARPDDTWIERWELVASPVWNVTISGLNPIFEPRNPNLVPVWHPWPGESVDLAVSRPEAIPGATVTINNGTQTISVGKRQRTTRLDLSLRCSLGEDFPILLPSGAEVTALTFDGSAIPVRKDGDKVIVPLRPGDLSLTLEWKTNTPLGPLARAEEVRLPVESANVTTVMTMPSDRWVLWTDGPLRGPAVRFWTVLVCSLLAAWILGRVPASPLRPLEWMLLTIGLTQVPLFVALLVVAWLFFLAWRGRESFLRLPMLGFNLLQIVLIGLTAMALGIFVAVVAQGLLGNPEMFIAGNGSSRTTLYWYQPQSDGGLPRPGCVSVSIWWFRILMLVWALWLAAALIRWLRWGWEQFSTGGCFRRKAQVGPVPPPLP